MTGFNVQCVITVCKLESCEMSEEIQRLVVVTADFKTKKRVTSTNLALQLCCLKVKKYPFDGLVTGWKVCYRPTVSYKGVGDEGTFFMWTGF